MAGPFARLRRGGDAGADSRAAVDSGPDPTANGADTDPTTEMPTAGAPDENRHRTEAIGGSSGEAPHEAEPGDTEILPAVVPFATPQSGGAADTEVGPGGPLAAGEGANHAAPAEPGAAGSGGSGGSSAEAAPGPTSSGDPSAEAAPGPTGSSDWSAEAAPGPTSSGDSSAEVAPAEPGTESMAVVGPQPPTDAPAPPDQPADAEPATTTAPSFLTRGRMRRRLRFVRRAREVALRDLGGLVFDLHRFGRDRHDLVDQKLAALGALDAEMRALGQALDDPDDVTVLREPGLAGCPRCGALHASDARFCSTCGLPVGKGASLPAGPTFAGPAPNPDAAVAAQEPPASGDPRAHEP